MTSAHVITANIGSGLRRIALRRPEKRNAMTPAIREALTAAVEQAVGEQAVQGILLASEGGWFCAGGDISTMDRLDEREARQRISGGHRLVNILASCEKPVVASVEGAAAGAGAGLALLADYIVAGEAATFAFSFFRVGLIPDFGILHTLPRRVGAGTARRLIFSGKPVGAHAAVHIGLADESAATDVVERRAVEVLTELSRLPPHAFALTKRQLSLAPVSLAASLEMEALGQALCFGGSELQERVAAFRTRGSGRFDLKEIS